MIISTMLFSLAVPAVAVGNPDTADNVATSVPGKGAKLEKMGTHLGRSERILAKADGIGSPGEKNAAIAWLGYEAPQNLTSAANPGLAELGARDLPQFQDGLRATHEGAASNNTLIGHSFGSTVIGHAAEQPDTQLDADNVVFIGSPGVGAVHESQLHLPDDADVYASTAEHDIINATPRSVHGEQPTNPVFGAETFESSPGTEGSSWAGGLSKEAHSEYWYPRSESLKHMGRIVVGKGSS